MYKRLLRLCTIALLSITMTKLRLPSRLPKRSRELTCLKCAKIFRLGANEASVNSHLKRSACRAARRYLATATGILIGSIGYHISAIRRKQLVPGLTFWTTYPFQLHVPGATGRPKYDLILSELPKARSAQCLGAVVTLDGLFPCSKCSALTLDIGIIKERASRSYERIRNHENLNSDQLHAKVTTVKEQVNDLKLKNLDLKDSVTCAQARLLEWKDLFHFIGQNSESIPALHRLLANAEKEGWGPKKILEQCQLAKAGKYTARNYTQYEIDLAIELYELSGEGSVYSMNHSIFALPSRKTIQPYRQQFNLVPSVGGLRLADVSRNITTLFGSHTLRDKETNSFPPIKCGHTLSFDELATERKVVYMTETDEMGGFCIEHLAGLDTIKVGKYTHTVEAAVSAVKEGKVHISHETCVGAISRLYETNYGAKPVFMGPTCKKGPWQDGLWMIEMVLGAWKRSPDGEVKHGPILSVATDGDHKRRLVLFILCMQSEILPGNPLYPYVRNLPGLNLRVGKDNITNNSDPKHTFKRTRSSLCSPEGIVVKNVCINRDLLLGWLERLPDHDWSETTIHNLLDPSDAQNVANSIKLLMCIVEIVELDPKDFDPSEVAEFEALCLLGEPFDALLQPFINTELSLSEQIQSLVTFSHLLCALYVENGTSFIPNQLYADMQAMAKNAVLMVPKTRLINGKMIGGHSPNCSVGELRDRFSSAMNLDYIYECHPELERKPRRLNMTRMRHVDHLRPSHFKRELRADSCDLDKVWMAGIKAAEQILAEYGVRMAMSFSERSRRKDRDLSRPMGGKYPAVSSDVDRSMANLSSNEGELIDPNTVDFANLVAGLDLDAMAAAEKLLESSPSNHSLFAEIDISGNLAHKKSILRTFFDMTHETHASHDRLQRVRGFTIGGKSWTRDTETAHNILSTSYFQLGSLFTTLVCHNRTHLGLAVAKCTLIKRGMSGSKAASLSAIPRAELHLAASPFMISGQVLSLAPYDSAAWAWDGEFISFDLKKKKKNSGEEIMRLCNLQLTVSSRLIDCDINDQALEISALDLPGDRDKTWSFRNSHLLSCWNKLWTSLLNDSSLHEKFPIFTGVSEGAFPYQTLTSPKSPGTCYASPIANTAIEQSITARNTCRVCGKAVKDQDRQGHVGEHIMKSLRGVEDSVKVPISAPYPCGMCGGTCQISIKGGKADSDCPSAYPFLISAAKKFLPTRPCSYISGGAASTEDPSTEGD
ncbi:hypothetical protein B0H10DRAFT_2371775 [Mycena sp. CBHHK59/15]|nr:hypothetical protein B0H10DRAFT_2371775 [Mycena sp. CBHHK59/15]